MKDPKHVKVNHSRIQELSSVIKLSEKPTFKLPTIENELKTIIIELVAASINYCYWYGRSDVRPNGANSSLMYELLMNSFYDFEWPNENYFNICIERYIKILATNRFPMLEDRVRHLRELKNNAIEYCITIENKYTLGLGSEVDIEYLFNELIERFPGFASDIFLKRASLFFIQLYRRFGWFDEELKNIHVPADYQIPKMLEHYGCIEYSPTLKEKILQNQLILKNSIEECEIRAATIIAMKEICDITGWNIADIDTYFFTERDLVDKPFHLTITTDY
jgi:hypothetical protein